MNIRSPEHLIEQIISDSQRCVDGSRLEYLVVSGALRSVRHCLEEVFDMLSEKSFVEPTFRASYGDGEIHLVADELRGVSIAITGMRLDEHNYQKLKGLELAGYHTVPLRPYPPAIAFHAIEERLRGRERAGLE